MKKSVPLTIAYITVIANYIAQLPYNLHLYGTHINISGLFLLLFTLIWFLGGFFLLYKTKSGYYILLSFFLIQIIFYARNEIFLMLFGYGFLFHLLHTKDWILWIIFMIGDLNFFGAIIATIYLLQNRRVLTKITQTKLQKI